MWANYKGNGEGDMRTSHNGSEYELVFKHLYTKSMYNKETGEFTYTIESDSPLGTLCTIKADGFEIAEGLVWLHVDDQCNKAEGRKAALTKAITDFSKPLRTALWECYLDRKPDSVLDTEKIIREAAWDDDTVLSLCRNFIFAQGMEGKFNSWLISIARQDREEELKHEVS
jgi:hypothetical protein